MNTNKLILIVALSYFLIGFLLGLWWTFTIAGDDLAYGFMIPASMLLWPLFLFDNIFTVLAPTMILVGLVWFVIRNWPIKRTKTT